MECVGRLIPNGIGTLTITSHQSYIVKVQLVDKRPFVVAIGLAPQTSETVSKGQNALNQFIPILCHLSHMSPTEILMVRIRSTIKKRRTRGPEVEEGPK
ncbi:hypothetical protein AVEN_165688-1 [Araneus ventricosus]|uniref:Uncharacterized protein n=1 Tax=Araneus ventricosus TaxID=182803 RepID=A0A4Y2C418_ARAVE|nr:hypothetical protein AVEN_165688-1 [Araneus ventricosus]